MEGLGLAEPKDYVRVSVRYDESLCDTEYPLYIFVENNYTRDLHYLTFYVSGRNVDFSSSIYHAAGEGPYSTDRIVRASTQVGSCWRVPKGSLDEFCDALSVVCAGPGAEQDAAWLRKTQEYPVEEMFWTVEVDAMRFSD